MKDKGFLAFLLCFALSVHALGYTPEYDQYGRLSILKSDVNRDGYFDITDVSLGAAAWLEQDCGLNNPCNGADVYPEGGDGKIDGSDFAVIAQGYGESVDPTNPACLGVPLTLYEPPNGGGVLQGLITGPLNQFLGSRSTVSSAGSIKPHH